MRFERNDPLQVQITSCLLPSFVENARLKQCSPLLYSFIVLQAFHIIHLPTASSYSCLEQDLPTAVWIKQTGDKAAQQGNFVLIVTDCRVESLERAHKVV